MEVSVIIPNYNGAKFILQCLENLYKQTFRNFEVIVVDNNSSDDSCLLIESNYPDVRLKKLDENLGFSAAVNIGIKLAVSPFVLLLNNDAFIENDFIEILYNKITQDNNIFSCCGKMLKFYDQETIEDTGDFYTILGWAYQRGNGEGSSQYCEDNEVFSCCAGAAMYRKSIFDMIGYFDESFFAYLEDIDLGFRSKLFGYKNWYCHKARCFHVGSATTGGGYTEFKVRLSVRNNIYLIYKNFSTPLLLFNLLFFLVGWVIRYFYFSAIGLRTVCIEATLEGMRSYKKIIKPQKIGARICFRMQMYLIRHTLQYVKYFAKRRFFRG